MHSKHFKIKIFAYQYQTEFNIYCFDGPIDIENAIVDKLGKSDTKWEYLGEMMDPKVNRITYEEVIDGGDNATSTRSIHKEEEFGSSVGARAS